MKNTVENNKREMKIEEEKKEVEMCYVYVPVPTVNVIMYCKHVLIKAQKKKIPM